MTPFELLQLVGPAVALHVAETLHAAFPDRFAVSREPAPSWSRRASPASTRPDFTLDPEAVALFAGGTAPSTAEQVRDRARCGALAEEIRLMLDEGVVAAAQDIDLCMILGAGWPFHLGGITPYLDRTGVSEPALPRAGRGLAARLTPRRIGSPGKKTGESLT